MRAARVLRHSLRGLARNRMRTFFMVLASFVGACALTVLLAIGQGTQQEILRRFDTLLSGSSMFVRAGGGVVRGGPHAGAATTLTLDDIRAADSTMGEILVADPIQTAGEREVAYAGRTRRIRIEGHSESGEVAWNRSVTRGSYLSVNDVRSAARVALVGEVVVRELFGGRDAVGEQIRIGTVPFQVIGVLAPIGVDPHGLDKDDEIVVPITTLMRRLRNVDWISGAKLVFAETADLDVASARLTDLLRRRHGLQAGQDDDFHLFTPVQVRRMVRQANRVFTVFLPLIAAIALVVGALVVANLMLLTVHERRAEIGLRKAVGARSGDIRLQFLAEAAAVTGLGGVLALVVAFGLLQVLAHLVRTPPGMPWATALLGLASAVAVGVVAGVVPARRAAELDPVVTLR